MFTLYHDLWCSHTEWNRERERDQDRDQWAPIYYADMFTLYHDLWYSHTAWESDGTDTGNGTGTTKNNRSWSLSLSLTQTSVNISTCHVTWYYIFHLVPVLVPVPYPCEYTTSLAVFAFGGKQLFVQWCNFFSSSSSSSWHWGARKLCLERRLLKAFTNWYTVILHAQCNVQ